MLVILLALLGITASFIVKYLNRTNKTIGLSFPYWVKDNYMEVVLSVISMTIKGGDQALMNINGEGKGTGTTHLAYEKGVLVNSEAEMDFNMSISAPLPTGQQEVPTTTHQKITLSLIWDFGIVVSGSFFFRKGLPC